MEDNATADETSHPTPRRSHPYKWRRNTTKLKKDSGLAHVSLRGKQRPARSIQGGCTKNCKKKCMQVFDDNQRQLIFNEFWAIGNHMQQWYYIRNFVKPEPVKRRTVVILYGEDARRNFSNVYHLPLNGCPIPVCQAMFLGTLGISHTWVKTALKKQREHNGAISGDGRGKNRKPTKVCTIIRADVMAHIKSFPTVEGHYTRKDSKSMYLPENLNRRKMHSMYVIQRKAKDATMIANLRQYRDVFKKEFKIKFFRPKKDQCGKCLSWTNRTTQEKTETARLSYEDHLKAKRVSDALKREDIKKVMDSEDLRKTVCVFSCDLEKILLCPKGEHAEFYYKRKLSVYNFTIFISGDQKGLSYVWDQTIGRKGCAEITSCLWDFFQMKVSQGIKEFRIYSDNCSAQNKNQFLFSMYVMASIRFKIKITHRYLEVGHTHMEVDSVHASIERVAKTRDIFVPSQWYALMKIAKVKKPLYDVKEMKQEEIFDFWPLAKHQTWEKVRTSRIREVVIYGAEPGKVRYKFDLEKDAKVVPTIIKQEPGRPVNWKRVRLHRYYPTPIPVKPKTLKDLHDLLDKGAIPSEHREYFCVTLPALAEGAMAPPAPPDLSDVESGSSDESEDSDDEEESSDLNTIAVAETVES